MEAALLREVARVQHQTTLLAVRDLIDKIPVTEYNKRSCSHTSLPAQGFRDRLIADLQALRIEAGE